MAGHTRTLADALLQAVDVLRHCVQNGAGCDDAAARRKAIEDGEAALRAVGMLPGAAPPVVSFSRGYGVTVRKAEVRAGPLDMMTEWQVWATNPKTGRPCIFRRFSFELAARAAAIELREMRKKGGMAP